jgi:hypothetical protein
MRSDRTRGALPRVPPHTQTSAARPSGAFVRQQSELSYLLARYHYQTRRAAEQQYLHREDILFPTRGLGKQLNDVIAWCNERFHRHARRGRRAHLDGDGRAAPAEIGAWIAFHSPLHHTHLAMPAIEKGFADQDAVAQAVLRCCGRDGQPHLPLCCRGRRG